MVLVGQQKKALKHYLGDGAWVLGMSEKQKAASSAKKNEMYVRVYDAINTKDLDEVFFHRYTKAMETIKGHDAKLKKVESYIVGTPEELYERQQEFVKEGYEGAMVRNISSPYKFGPSKSKLRAGLAYIQLNGRVSAETRGTYGGSVGLWRNF